MSAVRSGIRGVSSAGGQVLRAATRLATKRPAVKPLHPRGSVVSGTVCRHGTEASTGVAWLDHEGEDSVLVRQSRAIGLPSSLPDIFGLAVRVTTSDGRHGDLLFASTGLGRLTRYTLTASRSLAERPLTTLLPYRAPIGPVVLSAVFRDESRVALAWAGGTGAWHPFAELLLNTPAETDLPLSFDPVRNTLPGLENYEWVRRLREPSYLDARNSRST